MARSTTGPSPRPNQRDEAARNTAVLDAASEVFLEFGFQKASTAEIARRARTSKRALYDCYSSKEAIFIAVMRRRSDTVIAPFMTLNDNEPPATALRGFGLSVLRLINTLETRKLHPMVAMASISCPELARQYWDNGPGRAKQKLQHYLAAQNRGGHLSIDDASEAAELFFGALLGTAVMRTVFGQPPILTTEPEQSRRVDRAVSMFLRVYAA